MAFDASQAAYRALRDIAAERTRNMIAWVGAGLSAAAGLPGWSQLKNNLLKTLQEKAHTLAEDDAKSLEGAARAASAEPNPWTSFQILRKHLGATTYRDSIRDALRSAAVVNVPAAYRLLWQMGVQGILTLNLDRLAARGFLEQFPNSALAEFSGGEVGRLSHLLNTPRRFVANLHGIIDDSESWILTRAELRQLVDNEAYQTIIRTCLTSSTAVFVGITADDIAVGGHLELLSQIGVHTPSHFWITNRQDLDTDKWAERVGIRVIRYASRDDDHSELSDLFNDLLTFVPKESEAVLRPVSLQSAPLGDDSSLPSPASLATQDANAIRLALNRHAVRLLDPGTEESYRRYDEFCRAYDEAIYRAWYISVQPGQNQLLNYTVEKQVARGAFGRVFRARDSSGELVAIKVLHEEIRSNRSLLRSFRRGVRSMTILNRQQVDGMVAYSEHSEIPAFVAMQWIDGPNLTEAKNASHLDTWPIILAIAVQLTDIVRRAHSVPERVLHRDLRPQNVMLEGFYSNPDAWRVVVLDFDLSWHRGAVEQSVLHTSAVGYLAPEQLQSIPEASTRNAAVDSFGVGMTLYFLCSGKDPLPDQHRHNSWSKDVRDAVSKIGQPQWRSLSRRFERLVICSTRDKQSERWDFAEISGELARLYQAATAPENVSSAELMAEEISATTRIMADYQWDIDRASAMVDLPTGLRIVLSGDEAKQRLGLSIDWQSTGVEDRKRVGKYIERVSRTVVEKLRAGGWATPAASVAIQTMHIDAEIGMDSLKGRIDDVSAALDRSLQAIRFD